IRRLICIHREPAQLEPMPHEFVDEHSDVRKLNLLTPYGENAQHEINVNERSDVIKLFTTVIPSNNFNPFRDMPHSNPHRITAKRRIDMDVPWNLRVY